MSKHIHAACIIAAAEDTTRVVWYGYGKGQMWVRYRQRWNPPWYESLRYRVTDADGNVIAETPAPKPPRVRIPETTLPAPLESLEGYEHVWAVGRYCTDVQKRPVAHSSSTLKWATEAEAREWLDFLTAPREVVEDE